MRYSIVYTLDNIKLLLRNCYVGFGAKYYLNNNKLTVFYSSNTSASNAKVHEDLEFYFNDNELEELFNFKVTQTFKDNSTLYKYFKTTYAWSK